MDVNIPDGEYDLDLSSLFSSFSSDVFGIRYGFRPDTIDQSYASHLVLDNDSDTFILKTESKENPKAVTSTASEINQFLFEGKLPTSTTGLGITSNHNNNNSNNNNSGANNMNEFVLVYDHIQKSFKMDKFNGVIKMNKSRELEKVNNRMKSLQTKYDEEGINLASTGSSFIDNFLIFNKGQQSNPLSYHQTISEISPIKKRRKEGTPSGLLSPKKVSAAINIKSQPQSPLIRVASPTSATARSLSPVSRSFNSNNKAVSIINSVGKQKKSKLLRAAERVVGRKVKINKLQKHSIPNLRKEKLAPFDNKMITATRVMKMAKPEDTAFQINLVQPTKSASTGQPFKNKSIVNHCEKAAEFTGNPESETLSQENVTEPLAMVFDEPAPLTEDDIEGLAEELEEEMQQDIKEDNDSLETFNKSEKFENPTNDKILSDSDDFPIDFSDWEDSETVEVPIKDKGDEFQVIVDNNPLKSKSMIATTEKNVEDIEPIESTLIGKKNVGLIPKSKAKLKSKPKPKLKVKGKAKTKPRDKAKSKSTAETDSDVDDMDIDLDEELDKAFDDLEEDELEQDEEDMSEEE